MNLTDATAEEIATELFNRGVVQTLQYGQAIVDASAKLTAAGITLVADHQDTEWIGVNFPTDAGTGPRFWAGVVGQITTKPSHSSHPTATVRVSIKKLPTYLASIEAVL